MTVFGLAHLFVSTVYHNPDSRDCHERGFVAHCPRLTSFVVDVICFHNLKQKAKKEHCSRSITDHRIIVIYASLAIRICLVVSHLNLIARSRSNVQWRGSNHQTFTNANTNSSYRSITEWPHLISYSHTKIQSHNQSNDTTLNHITNHTT